MVSVAGFEFGGCHGLSIALRVEQGHGDVGEVAAVRGLPFFMHPVQDSADESDDRGLVWEDPYDTGPALDTGISLLTRLSGFVDQTLDQWAIHC